MNIYPKTDWVLLRSQKERLAEVMQGFKLFDPDTPDLLEGLFNFISAIQDDAESRGYAVYPDESEDSE